MFDTLKLVLELYFDYLIYKYIYKILCCVPIFTVLICDYKLNRHQLLYIF